MQKLSLLFFILCFTACKQESIQDLKELSPLWEKAFFVSNTATINPIFNSGFIIYSPYDDPAAGQSASSKFIALDPNTGEVQWEWYNTLKPTNEGFLMSNPIFSINNQLFFSNGPRVYALNGKTGKTIWQRQFGNYGSDDLFYMNENLYFSYGIDNSSERPLVKLDFTTGLPSLFLISTAPDSIKEIYSNFISTHKSMFYSLTRSNLLDENNYIKPFIVKYDFETKEQLFESQIMEAGWDSFISQFHLYNEEIVIATVAKKIIGVSTATGEVLWTTNVKGTHTFAPLLITDTGLVYSNTDDKVYCIEGTTGQILWEIEPERHGISSRMVLHKGVLYYISGGLLYALDANTGEVLLALEAPSALNPKFNMNFQPVMTLDAENDRIYTASYSHAYCYPTLR